MFTVVWYSRRKLPTVPANAPSITKTMVKPVTKPTAPFNVFAVVLSPPPAKYEMYMGSIGSKQGDIKVIIPSRNDIKYCIIFHSLYVLQQDILPPNELPLHHPKQR